MAKYENEMLEVINWLKHPNELAKEPATIEFAKEFTDEEDFHCIIFRFKEDDDSPWLMAIHSDSGIFSEMEEYDEDNDVEQATEMLEYLKQYWKNVARNEEEKKQRLENAKNFSAFVLKKEPKFEPEAFLDLFEKDWGEKLEGTDDDGEAKREGTDARIYTNEEGMRLIIGYMDFPVPNNEAEINAQYNFMWKDAVEVTASHTAHEVVFVSGGESLIDRAFFYSKVIATLCKLENNIALYTNGVVYEAAMVVNVCELIKDGRLPVPVLVWVGLGRSEEGVSSWTDGMKCFGLDELEVVQSDMQPSQLHGLMLMIVDYCISNDVGFHDGETVALSASEQIMLEKSKGYNVDEEGETLKITFL